MRGKVNINLDDFVTLIKEKQEMHFKCNEKLVENLKLKEDLSTLKAELLQLCIYDNNIHDEYYHNIDNVGYAFHHREVLDKYYTHEELLKYIVELHEATKENKNDD